MKEKTTTVINASGIHARPAALFVAQAKTFFARITITNCSTGKSADAKSMLKLLLLGLSKGTAVRLSAEGSDEEAALDALIAMIDAGLGEA